MTLAHRLTIAENLLGILSVQIHYALAREDSREADQERNQADVYPGETHGQPL